MKRSRLLCLFIGVPFLFSCLSLRNFEDVAYAFEATWTLRLNEGESSDLDTLKGMVYSVAAVLDTEGSIRNGLTKLNEEGEATLEEDAYDCLKIAYSLYQETEGYYHPLLGRLSRANKAALEAGAPLNAEEALAMVIEANATTLAFEDSSKTVRKTGNGQIDLGGIGKGYCQKKQLAYLEGKGFTKYLIDGGTSSWLIGKREDGGEYGVRPSDYQDLLFYCSKKALSTSSISRQQYEIDGVTYSHIIHPKTGSSIPSYTGITVLHDDPAIADALSTAMMSMELSDIGELASSFSAEALVIRDGGIVYETDGFRG